MKTKFYIVNENYNSFHTRCVDTTGHQPDVQYLNNLIEFSSLFAQFPIALVFPSQQSTRFSFQCLPILRGNWLPRQRRFSFNLSADTFRLKKKQGRKRISRKRVIIMKKLYLFMMMEVPDNIL